MKSIYTNCIGCFAFKDGRLMDKVLFKKIEDYENKEYFEKQLFKKYPHAQKAEMVFPFEKEYLPRFHEFNVALAKKKIQASIAQDIMIIQAVSNIDDINKVSNNLIKRFREWYGYYFPELCEKITNNEKLIALAITRKREELIKEFRIEQCMGADISREDIEQIMKLGKQIDELFQLKKKHTEYLENVMNDLCPNLKKAAGAIIAAELISHAGGLRRLAVLPSSTIQILGAEKALFRHLMDKRCSSPKHGLIVNHPLLANAKKEERGKIARKLASQISMAARIDFFRKEKGKKQ